MLQRRGKLCTVLIADDVIWFADSVIGVCFKLRTSVFRNFRHSATVQNTQLRYQITTEIPSVTSNGGNVRFG
jgi:hypothetical protein